MFRSVLIIPGALSCTYVAWKGFDVRFESVLIGVLESYEQGMRWFFGFVEPTLHEVLATLRANLGLESLQLYPHWKHVFVLLWIYFSSLARAALGFRDLALSIFVGIWGVLVALISSVASGMIILDGSNTDMLMAFFAVLGVVVFEHGFCALGVALRRTEVHEYQRYTSWELFLNISAKPRRRGLFAGCVLLLGTLAQQFPYLPKLSNPGLTVLALLAVLLALTYVRAGTRVLGGKGETLWAKFYNDSNTRVGAIMLGSIGGSVVIVLLNLILGALRP